MKELSPTPIATTQQGAFFGRFSLLFAGLCVFFWLYFPDLTPAEGWNKDWVTVSNRTLNALLGASLTAMAIISPLVSNFFTPRLTRLFLRHPIMLSGLTLLLVSNVAIVALNMVPQGAPYFRPFYVLTAALAFTSFVYVVPLGVVVTRFLQPSYVIPFLENRARDAIQESAKSTAGDKQEDQKAKENIFGTANILTNITLTAMGRGDRDLAISSTDALLALLTELVLQPKPSKGDWRDRTGVFITGISQEGQDYLRSQKTWPEAYMLSLTMHIIEQASRKQHELLFEIAERLVKTAETAAKTGRGQVVHLHIIVFNAMFRLALEEKDSRRIQNLSYCYCQLAFRLYGVNASFSGEIARHLKHYASLGEQQGLSFARETAIYDLTELNIHLAKKDESAGLTFFFDTIEPFLNEGYAAGGHLSKVVMRAVVKAYWDAKSHGLERWAQELRKRFLVDEKAHRAILDSMLATNTPLNWEFNDRLVRFSYLGENSGKKAREWLQGGGQNTSAAGNSAPPLQQVS